MASFRQNAYGAPNHSMTMNRTDYDAHAAATSNHPVFADASALFGDYGYGASQNAYAVSHAAFGTAQGAVVPRSNARRSIEAGNPMGMQQGGQNIPMQMQQQYQGGQLGLAPPAGIRAGSLSYPRSSIGTGHPVGFLQSPQAGQPIMQRMVDLSPLLPAYQPQIQGVPAESDFYHRTSVYAASGVPFDLPSHAKASTWVQRVQHGRP
eukprot:GEMP01070914.1.p1 GENE.GEMP01070914.1~~GEMP01070914.1.p1  ORF type:complete len:207 (+),score=38.82 GEMP01070914.1:176-796(+)